MDHEDKEKEVEYWWFPMSLRNPYSPTVLEFTDSSITFDGYFYESNDNFPLQRVLALLVPDRTEGNTTHMKRIAVYHIEITEKIEGKDTSEYGPFNSEDSDDDDCVGVCFFPTNIVTLRFRILQKDFDKDEENRIYAALPKKQK